MIRIHELSNQDLLFVAFELVSNRLRLEHPIHAKVPLLRMPLFLPYVPLYKLLFQLSIYYTLFFHESKLKSALRSDFFLDLFDMLALPICNAITFKSVVDHFDMILISLTSSNWPSYTDPWMTFSFNYFTLMTHDNSSLHPLSLKDTYQDMYLLQDLAL